jgi:hypothetical protein
MLRGTVAEQEGRLKKTVVEAKNLIMNTQRHDSERDRELRDARGKAQQVFDDT